MIQISESHRLSRPRKHRLLSWGISAIVLVITGLVIPTVTAPAAHAAAQCSFGSRSGPYWWGNVKATNAETGRMVLAIESPWGYQERAYLWHDNNDNRQKFYLQCSSYNAHDRVNSYLFRYAYNDTLCLSAPSGSPGTRLLLIPCGWSGYSQNWEQWADGTAWVDGRLWQTYRFKHPASEACFDAYGGGTSDGTPVQLYTCKPGDHQRWF